MRKTGRSLSVLFMMWVCIRSRMFGLGSRRKIGEWRRHLSCEISHMLLIEKYISCISYSSSETWESNSGSINISGSDTHVEATYLYSWSQGEHSNTNWKGDLAGLAPVVAMLCAGPGCDPRGPIMSRSRSRCDFVMGGTIHTQLNSVGGSTG